MIIVFEGLEGVGKTTLTTQLANIWNIGRQKSPPPEFDPVRGYIASLKNPNLNFYFYLSGVLALQNKIERYKENKTDHIVIDRYILSTIAYHNFGRTLTAPHYEESLVLSADLTINVICDEELRTKRITRRGFHIFERNEVDESTIEKFFFEKSDINVNNSGNIEGSINFILEKTKSLLP